MGAARADDDDRHIVCLRRVTVRARKVHLGQSPRSAVAQRSLSVRQDCGASSNSSQGQVGLAAASLPIAQRTLAAAWAAPGSAAPFPFNSLGLRLLRFARRKRLTSRCHSTRRELMQALVAHHCSLPAALLVDPRRSRARVGTRRVSPRRFMSGPAAQTGQPARGWERGPTEKAQFGKMLPKNTTSKRGETSERGSRASHRTAAIMAKAGLTLAQRCEEALNLAQEQRQIDELTRHTVDVLAILKQCGEGGRRGLVTSGNRDVARVLEQRDFRGLLRRLALQTTRDDALALVFSGIGFWGGIAGGKVACLENADFVEALVGAMRAIIANNAAGDGDWQVRVLMMCTNARAQGGAECACYLCFPQLLIVTAASSSTLR